MKKIAIIGAGFSGLAVAYHLLLRGINTIDLYDKKGIGGGASGVAAGLLHPYAGAHAKKNPYGDEAMLATTSILDAIEKEMGAPCSQRKGILRVALTEEQEADYRFCADNNNDVSWIDDCSKVVPGVHHRPGILIHSGMSIHCPTYLEGLWKFCAKRGVQFFSSEVQDLQNIAYDRVIVTGGMETIKFKELATLKIRPIKGQILQLTWPKDLPPLPLPLNSQAYLVMDPSGKSVWAGATFERQFEEESPHLAKALEYLKPKIEALYPPLGGAAILSCSAALRAATPDHHPIFGSIDDRISYLTGLGSKGLLYHAYYAQKVI